MTCVLSPWQPFGQSYGWSPMDPALPPSIPSDFGKQNYHHATPESESTQASSGSGKKRTSRAGTRSVSTLSAAQLERKRANDRDAQRAIRQRTKDHIDSLEKTTCELALKFRKTISDLRITQEATEKLLAATQQQNREFKEENTYLWSKLKEAGVSINVPGSQKSNPLELSQLPADSNPLARQISDLSSPTTNSNPQSTISVATSQSSDSQLSSWQQSQSSMVQSATSNGQVANTMQNDPHLTTWRSHNGAQAVEASAVQNHDLSPKQPHTLYGPVLDPVGAQWTMTPQPHVYHEQQLSQQYAHPPQQQEFPQPAVRTYTPHNTPQPSTYQTPVPPQAEFQGMTVASPVVYQMPHQHPAFGQQGQYQISPTNPGPTELSTQSTSIQHAPALGIAYNSNLGNQNYGQHIHQPGDFRAGSGTHSYPGTHYES